jgi:hypothetical protein
MFTETQFPGAMSELEIVSLSEYRVRNERGISWKMLGMLGMLGIEGN